MKAHCEYPRWEPSKEHPSSDCGIIPPVMAAPLGESGRWIALCAVHAPHRLDAIPIGQVPEP